MPERPSPLRIGVIREGKVPPDSRVPLTPEQAAAVAADPRIDLAVQPSPGRCFADGAYRACGVPVREDLSDRDVLLGVKEVPIEQLIAGKTYFFFSHTHKEQEYNRDLLRAALERRITLIDYELLTDETGARLIAFGRFAGMVGAHHALRAWGLRTGRFDLPQMRDFEDYAAAQAAYAKTDWGPVRVVSTGTGRVGRGSVEVLRDAGLAELTPAEFVAGARAGEAVFTQLGPRDYVRRRSDGGYDRDEFRRNPGRYVSAFRPYAEAADVLVHGIFWDNAAPAMFDVAQMRDPDWRVRVIADVTCDIAPVTSIPATLRPSTIADPYFGFDPATGEEVAPWREGAVTMMTVDNLPNELPRDASKAFGTMFTNYILPELLADASDILDGATIARDGQLTPRYRYLEDFVAAAP